MWYPFKRAGFPTVQEPLKMVILQVTIKISWNPWHDPLHGTVAVTNSREQRREPPFALLDTLRPSFPTTLICQCRRFWMATTQQLAATIPPKLRKWWRNPSILGYPIFQTWHWSRWFAGWWFGFFFNVPFHIWDNPSHWLIFFKMVKTINQICHGQYISLFVELPSISRRPGVVPGPVPWCACGGCVDQFEATAHQARGKSWGKIRVSFSMGEHY